MKIVFLDGQHFCLGGTKIEGFTYMSVHLPGFRMTFNWDGGRKKSLTKFADH